MGTAQLPLLVSAPGKVILHGEHAVVYGKVWVVQLLSRAVCGSGSPLSTVYVLIVNSYVRGVG